MKNQYFGDVNDYFKYGLLRALQSTGELRILVAWMLTPNDSSGDGELRAYLQDERVYRHRDAELFDGLTGLLCEAPTPSVSLVEQSKLLPRTTFYSTLVPDTVRERTDWQLGLLEASRNVDLVFFDPDNGFEVRSKPIGRKGSSKYATWGEIQTLWRTGRSILVYQHFARVDRLDFVRRLAVDLGKRTGAEHTAAFQTPRAVYMLAAQDSHVGVFQKAICGLVNNWGGDIEVHGAWLTDRSG